MLKIFSLILLTVFIIGCRPKPYEDTNQEELITSVNLYFVDSTNFDTTTWQFKDPDGEGGLEPIISTKALDTNTSYILYVELLDESKAPAESITEEVEEEGDEHQFFFISSDNNLLIQYSDMDIDGLPIGLVNSAKTFGGTNSASLKIILRHQPDKNGSGVSMGDITHAGGESDVEILFPFSIQ